LEHSAVQLFNERARATSNEFTLTDADAPALCGICRKLDGLPLALELAAVQVHVLGIQGLARALNDRFAVLIKGLRTALGRQRTLRATMDWSHDLLPEIERVVLRRLAVFRGDFTIDGACAVVVDEQISSVEVVMSVAALANRSLVATNIGGDTAHYHLLDTTREYALEKLVESDDVEPLQKRHAEYYLSFFAPAEGERESKPRAEWLAVYGRHIDNARCGLDWALSPGGNTLIGVALTIAVVPLWTELSLLGECRERVERALSGLDTDAAATMRSRMQLSAALGWSLMYGVGRAREAGNAWGTTLKLAEELDDTHYRLRALWGLCIDQFNSGKVSTALEFARRFAGLVAGSIDAIELMMADRILATSLHYLGDQTNARIHIERALAHDAASTWQTEIARSRFDLRVSAHYFQARILWLQGFADHALRIVEHNIEEGRDIGQVLAFCSVLGQAACPIAYLAGDLEAAEQYSAMLIDHTERHPVRLWNIWGRCFNGLLMARRGDTRGGLRALHEGLEHAGEARFLPRFLFVQGEQAALLGRNGEPKLALESVDQIVARCEARDEGWYTPELLRIKGELMLARGDPSASKDAEQLFLASLDTARRQGALSWELRTATSLARLLTECRRRAEASALLTAVYDRFTEGFGTTDLRAAKSLLGELA
jgi:predicted ATPase